MKITTVLFDLDGTLLPMDMEIFIKVYFGGLAKKMAPHGYDPKELIDCIWAGIAAMVKNDGSKSNEKAFWDQFVKLRGEGALADMPLFEEYYQNDFDEVAKSCGYTQEADRVIKLLKSRGVRVVLATNPIFPAIATQKRIRWAGLEQDDFALITTYENSSHCKPNPAYYTDILNTLGLSAEECLMVGNDADEDMIAETLGMRVFLLTDCLINKSGADLSHYPQGGFDALFSFLEKICTEKR